MAEIKAQLSYLRKSARKVRLAADLIRGKSLKEAKENLKFAAKNSAEVLEKLLRSAEANAKNNSGIKPEKLFVKEIKINEGPTLKRFMPRAFGRAYQIRKRTSHILLTLAEK
jgi:large subunit ribosomal protein L22